MKKHILILAAANISTCPRPMRILEILKDEIKEGKYEVSVMGIDNEDGSPMAKIPHITTFSYPYYKKRNILGEIRLWFDVALRRWDRLSFIKNRLVVMEHIKTHRYDVIICHDLLLLPVLFVGLDSKSNRQEAESTRVIFDAREFYPLQNASSLRWRILFKVFNIYLCKTYAKRADKIFSVSPRFCELYKTHFGLKVELLLSLPPYYELNPKPINPQKIKILYHGALNKNRDIHKIIYLCQKLDKRFCMDFIFTGGAQEYRKKIESTILGLQKQGYNISVLPAVSLEQIVPFGNNYDIGFIYIPKHNRNLLATIPNKFFEYIQSRLALLLPPIVSLQDITEKYDNAIVSRNFSLDSLSHALNTLSVEEISKKKQNSHTAALEFNINQNAQKIRNILTELLA